VLLSTSASFLTSFSTSFLIGLSSFIEFALFMPLSVSSSPFLINLLSAVIVRFITSILPLLIAALMSLFDTSLSLPDSSDNVYPITLLPYLSYHFFYSF